jgi:hypothetical protein
MADYSILLTNNKPVAYVIEHPEFKTFPIFNAEFVESRFELLGDL